MLCKQVACAAFLFILFFPLCSSQAESLEINPLVPIRQQMRQLNRDCSRSWDSKRCEIVRNKLREKLTKLRIICRRDPEDERCGSIMVEKKERGWRIRQYCNQNPYSKKCTKRRERERRRAKLLRRFCQKNPDEKRCDPPRRRQEGRGYGSLHEYCKDYPEKNKCIALAQKYDRYEPKAEPEDNRF